MEKVSIVEESFGESGFMLFKNITRYTAIITSIITVVISLFITLWLITLSWLNYIQRYSPSGITRVSFLWIYTVACICMYVSGKFLYHDCEDLRILKQREKWYFIFFNLLFMFSLYYVQTQLHLYQLITFLPK